MCWVMCVFSLCIYSQTTTGKKYQKKRGLFNFDHINNNNSLVRTISDQVQLNMFRLIAKYLITGGCVIPVGCCYCVKMMIDCYSIYS